MSRSIKRFDKPFLYNYFGQLSVPVQRYEELLAAYKQALIKLDRAGKLINEYRHNLRKNTENNPKNT